MNSLSPEQLLKPRYRVIEDYPGLNVDIGHIFTSELGLYYNRFPAVFQLLLWYEGRTPEEMPEYFKYEKWDSKGVYIVDKVDDHKSWEFWQEEPIGIKYKTGGGLIINYILPASQQEYDTFKSNNYEQAL